MRRLLPCLLLLVPAVAQAGVTFSGSVQFYNPVAARYEPLPEARVRVVLWESNDWDTLDPEVTTASDGRWLTTKGNPWFSSGYGYQVIVYAETPGLLEIQNTLPQVNGYQGLMEPGYIPENGSVTTHIKIGGAQANVLRYACGGDDIIDRDLGEKAFFIFHEMTDHRRQLLAQTVVPAEAWEEKEVVFPYDQRVGSYSSTWDAIYLPGADTFSSYDRASEVSRHELSHSLVRDAYTVWNIPWGSGAAHTLYSPGESAERAWGEAIADFFAQYTFHLRYGRTTWPIGRLDDPARPRVNPLTDNRNLVEGDIASALWHLTHGGLDRPRAMPQVLAPQEHTYRDSLDDPRLDLLWNILNSLSPGAFVDETVQGDTVINHWLANRPTQTYDIKRVLFNHGLRASLPENEPTVQMLSHTWQGAVCEVRLRLLERDAEDLDHMRLTLLVNKAPVLNEMVPRARWRNDPVLFNVAEYTWRYEHVRLPGATGDTPLVPRIDAQIDDGMVSTRASLDLDPPTAVTIPALVCDVLGVALVNRGAAPRGGVRLKAAFGSQPALQLPAQGAWSAPAGVETRDPAAVRLGEIRPVGDRVQVTWQRLGGGLALPAKPGDRPDKGAAPVVETYTLTERFGLGEHTVLLPIDEGGSHLAVVYRISVPDPALHLAGESHLDRVLGTQASAAVPRSGPALTAKPLSGLAALDARALSGRASSLARRFAQLQRDGLATAHEIEWLLDANRRAQLKEPAKPAKPGQALTKPSQPPWLTAAPLNGTLLARPASPFLDQAAGGQVAFGPPSDKLRERLEPMARRVLAINDEVGRLCDEADQVRAKLQASATEVAASTVPGAAKLAFLNTVPDALTRLRALAPLGQDYRTWLSEQSAAVSRALGGQAPPKPASKGRAWRLEVLGCSLETSYTERFYQEKRSLQPRGEKAQLAVVRCRLTNTAATTQVPVLTERLAGETRLACAGGEKAELRDVDAAQASNKWQDYAASPVKSGETVEFALVFELPAGSRPERLWFTLQNYPEDVGGTGETREFALAP